MLLCTPGYPQTFSLPLSLKVGSQACITETAVKTKVVKGSNDRQRAGTTKTDNARPREVLIIYTQKCTISALPLGKPKDYWFVQTDNDEIQFCSLTDKPQNHEKKIFAAG